MSLNAIVHTAVALVKYAVVLVIMVVVFKLWTSRNYCNVASEDPGMRPAIGRTKLLLDYDSNVWAGADLVRDDIIIVRTEIAGKQGSYPFRVVAAPGDEIWIRSGSVNVNDQPKTSYPDAELKYASNHNLEKTLLPRGYVFLLADNRTDSFAPSPELVPVWRLMGKVKL